MTTPTTDPEPGSAREAEEYFVTLLEQSDTILLNRHLAAILRLVMAERDAALATQRTAGEWNDPDTYDVVSDLVLVRCVVTAPELSDLPRACELPVSSGDHAVGGTFISIGHANHDGEWFVAGWDMAQDCWTDARCFRVTGWQPLPWWG